MISYLAKENAVQQVYSDAYGMPFPPAAGNEYIYGFTSYSAETGGTEYGTGKVRTLDITVDEGWTAVEVMSNSYDDSWVGMQFKVHTTEPTGDTRVQLYQLDGTAIDVWVTIE